MRANFHSLLAGCGAGLVLLVGCATDDGNDRAAGVDPRQTANTAGAGNAGPSAGTMAVVDAGARGAGNDEPHSAGMGGVSGGAAGSGGIDSSVEAMPMHDAGGPTSPGTCSGDTPHGCYTPDPSNTAECPAQIPEQTEGFIVPGNEWTACGTPGNTCRYKKPDSTGNPNCFCDTGVHWICFYQ